MALSTTVVTMEMVSRPVGAVPLVAEANLANLTQSNKTCNFVVCCCRENPEVVKVALLSRNLFRFVFF
jgi:hypothetical protein